MPQFVAVAVVHSQPASVLIADDMHTMNWVLALRVVGTTSPSELRPDGLGRLRAALLQERWADAVTIWMKETGVAIDVYPSEDLLQARDVDLAHTEMQFLPLFDDADN